jgi:hypothetical protein
MEQITHSSQVCAPKFAGQNSNSQLSLILSNHSVMFASPIPAPSSQKDLAVQADEIVLMLVHQKDTTLAFNVFLRLRPMFEPLPDATRTLSSAASSLSSPAFSTSSSSSSSLSLSPPSISASSSSSSSSLSLSPLSLNDMGLSDANPSSSKKRRVQSSTYRVTPRRSNTPRSIKCVLDFMQMQLFLQLYPCPLISALFSFPRLQRCDRGVLGVFERSQPRQVCRPRSGRPSKRHIS